jgi:hypothetical protein
MVCPEEIAQPAVIEAADIPALVVMDDCGFGSTALATSAQWRTTSASRLEKSCVRPILGGRDKYVKYTS